MKNHKMIKGKLLQTNKKWSQLKQKQRNEIDAWMREEYVRFACENHRMPNKNDKDEVLWRVQQRIDEREIWIPCGEVRRHYESGINRYRKSLEECESYIHIRSAQPGDIADIREIVSAAFGREAEALLTDRLLAAKLALSGLSMLAYKYNQPVGYILFSRIEVVDSDGLHHPAAAMAPVSVKLEYQGMGVGSALVNFGLKSAKERGYRVVIVLGDPKYYARFGFKTASSYGIISPFDAEDKYFMAKRLDRTAATRRITGKAVYPAVWEESH